MRRITSAAIAARTRRMKIGIAGRVSGQVGDTYSSVTMFGKSAYPLFCILPNTAVL